MQKILIIPCSLLTLCLSLNVWADDTTPMQTSTTTTPASAPMSATSPAAQAPTPAAAPAAPAAAPTPPPIPVTKLKTPERPCKDIQAACEAAGYTGRASLFNNCLNPLRQGQAVKGVNIDPDLLKACLSKQGPI